MVSSTGPSWYEAIQNFEKRNLVAGAAERQPSPHLRAAGQPDWNKEGCGWEIQARREHSIERKSRATAEGAPMGGDGDGRAHAAVWSGPEARQGGCVFAGCSSPVTDSRMGIDGHGPVRKVRWERKGNVPRAEPWRTSLNKPARRTTPRRSACRNTSGHVRRRS